jgi:hypothetical protein
MSTFQIKTKTYTLKGSIPSTTKNIQKAYTKAISTQYFICEEKSNVCFHDLYYFSLNFH